MEESPGLKSTASGSDLATPRKDGDEDLVYWCQACRETGLLHCAYPDECGQLDDDKKIPRHEALKRRAALSKVTP